MYVHSAFLTPSNYSTLMHAHSASYLTPQQFNNSSIMSVMHTILIYCSFCFNPIAATEILF